MMSYVDHNQIDQLLHRARADGRKRSHLLLHDGHADQVQRLLVAMEPGTYVRPHKHSQQWEMLVVVRGAIDVLMMNDDGTLTKRLTLSGAAPAVQIPMRQCHGILVNEPGTLVLEVKPGPYQSNDFAPWSPEEGAASVAHYMSWAGAANPGDKSPPRSI